MRPSATTDDATPNSNAVAAHNLIRLAVFSGRHAWREQADRLLEGIIASTGENILAHLSLLNAFDLRLRAAEIVIAGQGPGADELLSAARRLAFLDRIVLRAASAASLPASHPALDKVMATNAAAAFVCVGDTCSLPVTSPAEIAAALAARRS